MSNDEPLSKPTEAEATERIREEACTLFVRWLFGPPALHIRDHAVHMCTTRVTMITPTTNEVSEHGTISLVPAA